MFFFSLMLSEVMFIYWSVCYFICCLNKLIFSVFRSVDKEVKG